MEENEDNLRSPEGLMDDVRHLKEWMAKELHLPKIEDEEWLLTFLYSNKLSLEKTKFKLDNYYSFKNKYPHMLRNRNPTAPELLQAAKAFSLAVSDRLTKDGFRLIHGSFNPDTDIFHITDVAKKVFMVFDALLLKKDRGIQYHIVFDFKNVRYTHFLKVLTRIKEGSEIFNDAYTERLAGVHALNPPFFMDKIVWLIKSFFPEKIASRIYIHSKTSTIFEMIDDDVLCSDFGGKGPSLAEYEDYTQQLLEKHKEWFKEQDNVCSNEPLRRKDENQLEEMKGSFRKLEVD